MTTGKTPPYIKLQWTASSLGANFDRYRIYSRPSILPAPPFTVIAELRPDSSDDRATFEAQHVRFHDYMAGWGAGPYSVGWDYTISVVDRKTGYESKIGVALDLRNAPTADETHWLTSNYAPYLNCPIDNTVLDPEDIGDVTEVTDGFMGRPGAFTRTRSERPGRRFRLKWDYFGPDNLTEERARWPRAIAYTGRQVALLVPRGDRVVGILKLVKPKQTGKRLTVPTEAEFIETEVSGQPLVANHNLPCGVVLNGSSQYVSVPHDTGLDPGSGPFSIVVAGVFANSGGSRVALSKGNLGTSDGYGLRTTGVANELQFFCDGTSSGGPTDTSATWFDDEPHVAVATSSGTAQVLYRDGIQVATSSLTHGSISNSSALVYGANNGGAAGFMALGPPTQFAVYDRVLTPTEAEAATGWLLGWHGYRMPGGAAVFHDSRDDRAWSATGTTILKDLAGNGRDATRVSSPTVRGKPWQLDELDILVPAAANPAF